jgi:hypothetical protein
MYVDRRLLRCGISIRPMSALGQKRKSSIRALDVRFAPESGHRATRVACPLCANSDQTHCSKSGSLLDHLVGAGEECRRNVQSQASDGFERAQKLTGDGAVALLCNTLPTGAILAVLILIFGPLSGAHFNSAVSIGFALRSELPWSDAAIYPLSNSLRFRAVLYAGVGAVSSLYFMYLQLGFIHAVCIYCLISAVTTFLLLFTALWHFQATRHRVMKS